MNDKDLKSTIFEKYIERNVDKHMRTSMRSHMRSDKHNTRAKKRQNFCEKHLQQSS
jgi:hypothetical protein